eukprot:15431433-Alexandrium_andersonii.AAC.1
MAGNWCYGIAVEARSFARDACAVADKSHEGPRHGKSRATDHQAQRVRAVFDVADVVVVAVL